MTSPERASFRLSDGAFIGSYRVQRPVRHDRWGETYVAKRTSEHRQVLLRVLPESAVPGGAADDDVRGMLQACSELEHSAIARTTPLQSEARYAFVASDCPGGSSGDVVFLADLLTGEGAGLPEHRVRSVALQLAEALAAGHRFRGTGIPCGDVRPESVVLTAQQQPRILHYGIAAALNPGHSPEDDIRQFGVLVYRLISGLPDVESQRSPSSFGVSRCWDRIVGACIQAGQEGGYGSAAEVVAAVQEAGAAPAGGGSRRLLGAAAAVIALVAIALAAVYAVRRNSDGERAEARTGIERTVEAAVDAERVAAVRSALQAGDLEAAETRAKALLAEHPRDQSVQGLAGEIAARRELANLEPVKTRALDALSQALDLSPSQGFQARIERLREQAKEAQGLLSRMKVSEAAAAYRDLADAADALVEADRARTEALGLRETLLEMLEMRETGPGSGFPADDRQKVEAQAAAANDALQSGRPREAKEAYAAAVRELSQLVERTAGRQRVTAARQAYEAERAAADPIVLGRLTDETAAAVEGAAARAQQAADAEQWSVAAAAWGEARARLSDALDAAAGRAADTGERAAPVRVEFARPEEGNLVLNGDLEEGEGGQPEHWSRMDGLTVSWKPRGNPGRCLVFDTSVQQKDKRALDANPDQPVARSEGGQYATVGAHEGVWAFAPPVPVTPEDTYFVVEADVWSTARSTSLFYPQVLLRGFQAFDVRKDLGTYSWFQTPHEGGPAFSEQFGAGQRRARQGDFLMVWRHGLVCRIDRTREWTHYRLAFKLPDTAAHRPDVLLLKCYAMWPLGEYRFDNVTLHAVDEAEFRRIAKEGHSIRGFMPLE